MRAKQIPIIVAGGLDTKTNPKLVKPGSALQIDNMFQQRPGEWRVRNGMTTQSASFYPVSSAALAYPGPTGGVTAIARGLTGGTPLNPFTGNTFPWGLPVRYGSGQGSSVPGWETMTGFPFPYASYAASTRTLFPDAAGATGETYDGDCADVGNVMLAQATGANLVIYDKTTGANGYVSSSGAQPRAVKTNNYAAVVSLVGSSPYSFFITTASAANAGSVYQPASLTGVVPAATPWFDVVKNFNSDTVTLAWKTATGVSFATVDLSTGTVTNAPVNYTTIKASMCLGWMAWEDGNHFVVTLACADATAGITTTSIQISDLSNLGGVTVDASVTANVRQITGHFDLVANKTNVLWELQSGTSRLYDSVWANTGAASFQLAPTFALYSRTAKGADGKWYFVGAYDSPTQGCYALLTCDTFIGFESSPNKYAAPVCLVMAGEGGGRRAQVSSIANLTASGSTFTCVLPRNKKVTLAGVSASKGRRAQLVTFSDALGTASRPRELGGVTYVPGGLIYGDDGQSCRAAVFPRYLEQPSLASSNSSGALSSSKTYNYRLVLSRQDAAGRIIRSAGSLTASVTLGASDNTVTVTVPNPNCVVWDFATAVNLEIYRAGPIEDGATLYNLVQTTNLNGAGGSDTVSYIDRLSNASAATGEPAYFTGNVEEHTAPPSTSLLEVNGGRIWIVNAEDPSELRFSKLSKAGTVPGFTPDFAVRLDGDGRGGVTALASMDGRLIAFKDGAIWVVSGDGPDDTGAGAFPHPQLVSRDVGVAAGLQRSVVSVPEGLMFQAARGIYLLDRGLGLTYLGAPVETYTQAATVVDASQVRGVTQVRFLMASGRTLVWDFQAKTWSTFLLPVGGSSVVACVDTAQGWYYLTADGKLRLEVSGATSDDGAAIVPVISLPQLSFAGLSGYQRLYSLDLLLDVLGSFTLSVDGEFNYSGAVTGQPKTLSLTPATPTAQVQYLPPDGLGKCTAMRPVITVSGAPTGGTFRLTSVTAAVGIKSGTNIVDTNRLQ